MVQGFFYNSVDGDRKYNADSVNESKRPFYRDGVFDGNLGVTADGERMAVIVDGGEKTGYAWINAHTIHNTTPLKLDISQASGTLDRIDRVVLRNDESERKPSIYILEGKFSSNPKAPELINTDIIQEKCLAEIYVHAGAVAITQADITDTREDETVCGFVVSQISSSSGSEIHPIYFSDGKPKACTYTLEKSVPANAVFTDTNTWRGIQNNLTSDSTTDSLSAAQGKVLKGLVDGKAASSHTHSTLNSFTTDGITFPINPVTNILTSVTIRGLGSAGNKTFGLYTSVGHYITLADGSGGASWPGNVSGGTVLSKGQVTVTTNPGSDATRGCNYINTNAKSSSGIYFLTVNGWWGDVSAASHNVGASSSDIRLKENIEDTEIEAIPILMKLKIRQFDWKDNKSHQKIGFIADELEEIDRHFAFGGGTDTDGNMNVKSVDTFYMQGYIVKAIQELAAWKSETEEQIKAIQKQNADQHGKITDLKKENAELKEQIRRMKEQIELILQHQPGKEE